MMQRGLSARHAMGLLALCLLACGGASVAAAASGPQLYASCAVCHGARGEGNTAVGAPAIAGQSAAYLERQLRNFRAGARGAAKGDTYGAQMRAANVATLASDKDLAALAHFVASLPKTSLKPAAKFDARNGNNLYQGKCGACHGGQAEGNDALGAPRLAGLDAAYLKRQLGNFRTGLRGAHPNDKYGRQMAMMARTITSERDVDDVIGYIHSVGSGAVAR